MSSSYEIPEDEELIHPLLLNATIPSIILKDADGNDFDVNKAIADKATIVLFFLGGW